MSKDLATRLAELLDYPGLDLAGRCAEVAGPLEAARPEAGRALEDFRRAIESLPLYRLEEIYAATFDLNPACCLYVGFHLFGESYKRGAFMARLNAEYRVRGFEPGNELPDHLGVVLRFLAEFADEDTRSWLLEDAVLPTLQKIVRAFDDTDNVYAMLVRAVALALEPPGYVRPNSDSRALPVLEPPDPISRESNHGNQL